MKVKAKRMGYYDFVRVREGHEFILADKKDFSKIWMEKLSKSSPLEPKPEPKLSDQGVDRNSEVI